MILTFSAVDPGSVAELDLPLLSPWSPSKSPVRGKMKYTCVRLGWLVDALDVGWTVVRVTVSNATEATITMPLWSTTVILCITILVNLPVGAQ